MFLNGGLAASVVTLLCAAWVACDNMIVLIHLAEKTGKNSYGQVWYAMVCHGMVWEVWSGMAHKWYTWLTYFYLVRYAASVECFARYRMHVIGR